MLPPRRTHRLAHFAAVTQAALLLGLLVGQYTVVDATCPPSDNDPLRIIFIGNSYTGGTGIGKACVDPAPDQCRKMAVPGNVRASYKGDTYPGLYDFPPDHDTLSNPDVTYDAVTNYHLGDVPAKIKMLADQICGNNAIEYVQNTQSAFRTLTHSGQSQTNPQEGTLHLLNSFSHDIVIIQPQSTEYLHGARRTRVSALKELLKRRDKSSPWARYFVQQTWPRRESTIYNQICTTKGESGKKGILEEVSNTIQGFSDHSELASTPFEVAPTGDAFVAFAKLACGEKILRNGSCAFDDSIYCPIWFGEMDKISLYHEAVGEPGTHQSEEIGAWLSASVLYGLFHSSDTCYVTEAHLAKVMPSIPADTLANIPSGLPLHYLISEAARLALEDTSRYGRGISECVESTSR